MTKKERINILYYEEKLNTVEIADKLKITKQYVSKVIKTDSRYIKEKETRKIKSAERHRKQKKEYARKKRQSIQNERLDASIDVLHRQASFELSQRRTINNRAFRNWNSSIYGYYKKTKEYRLKKEFENKVSYAVPKKIKWY